MYHGRYRTSGAARRLRFQIVKILELIPDTLKLKINTHSLKGFTQHYQKYKTELYPTTCSIENCYVCRD